MKAAQKKQELSQQADKLLSGLAVKKSGLQKEVSSLEAEIATKEAELKRRGMTSPLSSKPSKA
jgi:uncharacterized small protein (DUF1192 family)